MQDDQQNQQPQDTDTQQTVQQDAAQTPAPAPTDAPQTDDQPKAEEQPEAQQPTAEEPVVQQEEAPQEVKEEKAEEPKEDQSVETPQEKTEEVAEAPTEPTTEVPTESPAEATTTSDDQPSTEPAVMNTPKDDKKGAHWYVVHTYSGHETKVAATLRQRVESQKLQDKILDILVPTQEKIEIKEGKKNTIKEKIFPGYLLIRMDLDDNTWLAVRTTPGITSFVGNANKPTPLPEAEVESIKKFMAMEAPKFKATFSVGEAVRITDGPFSEFLGSINEIDEEKGKLKVMVSIFGRETPVELDFLQVAKL